MMYTERSQLLNTLLREDQEFAQEYEFELREFRFCE